jgi:hypothetical protein
MMQGLRGVKDQVVRHARILRREKRVGFSSLAGATGTADAVNVILN